MAVTSECLGRQVRDTSASLLRPFSDAHADLMWLPPTQHLELDLLAWRKAGNLLGEEQTLRRCSVHSQQQIPQFNVRGSRRRPGIHAADCGNSSGASSELCSGRFVDPKRLEAHSDVRLRKVAMLLDERDNSFDGLRRNSEDAPQRSWYGHGGDRPIHIDDGGSFEQRIEPNIDLEPSLDCSATP